MSTFRRAQSQAHPNKTSTLMLAIIVLLILNVTIQIWLLYSGLNNALEHNKGIAVPAFVGSLVLFFINCGLLYYLPRNRRS
jgi:membrane protein YdbS with pleckstrin-like domain